MEVCRRHTTLGTKEEGKKQTILSQEKSSEESKKEGGERYRFIRNDFAQYLGAVPRYSAKVDANEKVAKTQGRFLRVHFKNTHETVKAIKGMHLNRAKEFLKNVIAKKEIVPFRRFNYGVGRKAQCHVHHWAQGRWPEKSARYLLDLLKNAESNAEMKNLNTATLVIAHAQANRAPTMRRRTYRAHGRINPYQRSPSHVELILKQTDKEVEKPADAVREKKKISKKKQARENRRQPGGM